MFVRPNGFIDSDVMSKMTENNPLLAMMTDSEAIKKNSEAWLKAVPGMEEMPVNGLASHPMAAMAATSAIGFGLYSQMVGTIVGAMTSAMEAAENKNGDMTVMFNPLTFEWTGGSFEEEGTPLSTETAPSEPPVSEMEASAAEKLDEAIEDKPDAKIEALADIETQPAVEANPVKPAKIDKPAAPDDLKRISGIGPKLESVLNGLGVWTYAQIAAWSAAEIAWVDDFLQFSGRIERDEWLKQAASLSEA